MSTYERIVDTALHLFNTSGTDAVSTNHIAEALDISPGNLYYHFRNKEAIIRAVFGRLFATWDAELTIPEECPLTLDHLRQLMQKNFEIMWEYRFIYRELTALIQRDPELKASFIAVRRRGFADFRQLFDGFVSTGILKPQSDPQVVTNLAELCWMISEFWLPTLEISGQAVTKTQLQHGTDLMMLVIEPYLVRL